jgi:predicted MFS family arabinose efflux permease
LLGVEQLTNSFGLVVVSRGIASLAGTPIAGVVYDVTSSYDASFYVAGSLIIVAGLISCAIPLVHKHEKSKLKNEGLS